MEVGKILESFNRILLQNQEFNIFRNPACLKGEIRKRNTDWKFHQCWHGLKIKITEKTKLKSIDFILREKRSFTNTKSLIKNNNKKKKKSRLCFELKEKIIIGKHNEHTLN